jgi:hypothetical protein
VLILSSKLNYVEHGFNSEAAVIWGLTQANQQLWLIEKEIKH